MGHSGVRFIDLKYESDNSEDSATAIAYALFPEWKRSNERPEIKAFSEGITNTMLKISTPPSLVLRTFGPGAEPLTSCPREVASHALFASYGLAPSLLARFTNGLLYAFLPGSTCTAADLATERIWRGVARALGRWHATLPVGVRGAKVQDAEGEGAGGDVGGKEVEKEVREEEAPGDVWAVLRLWAGRMPETNEEERELKDGMRGEVEWVVRELGGEEGLGERKLVMGHCDLLAGNVLVVGDKGKEEGEKEGEVANVQLIDYEYSVAAPAAFDIAMHFGEWTGFECDLGRTPGREVRRGFVREYVRAWRKEREGQDEEKAAGGKGEEEDVEKIFDMVDRFRGLPGLWFGLWGLVQAYDSSEEFDYRDYAHSRLTEYWAWKQRLSGGEVPATYLESKRKEDGDFRERMWES